MIRLSFKTLICLVLLFWIGHVSGFVPVSRLSPQGTSTATVVVSSSAEADQDTAALSTVRDETKRRLLDLLAAVPRNTVTSARQTRDILTTVRQLEPTCPTTPADVLPRSAGTWELVWTAQDGDEPSAALSRFRWINPLENQAYSNNPTGGGRANPLLPLEIQNWLNERGILSDDSNDDADSRTSTQTIDIRNRRVINVVSLPTMTSTQRATLTVRVDFTPHAPDPRRVNVKFQSFRVALSDQVQFEVPFGILGPTGWLRTTYLDESLRITRGHKGSVFVLKRRRTSKKKTTPESD